MTPLDRRSFLQVAAVTTCAACLPLAACNHEEEPAGPLTIDPGELPEGVRVRRDWNGRPVELVREGDTITARSLLCTHQGCEVRWMADEEVYVCPCHDGRFDHEGLPLYGPPRRPLRKIAVTRRDGLAFLED